LKIVPKGVEEQLQRYGKIAEVAVVGTANPVLGESICVCIIPREGETVTSHERIEKELKNGDLNKLNLTVARNLKR
jgi:non-ribosomal peptide synthetase component E (peptide arylation enzyme)